MSVSAEMAAWLGRIKAATEAQEQRAGKGAVGGETREDRRLEDLVMVFIRTPYEMRSP